MVEFESLIFEVGKKCIDTLATPILPYIVGESLEMGCQRGRAEDDSVDTKY